MMICPTFLQVQLASAEFNITHTLQPLVWQFSHTHTHRHSVFVLPTYLSAVNPDYSPQGELLGTVAAYLLWAGGWLFEVNGSFSTELAISCLL